MFLFQLGNLAIGSLDELHIGTTSTIDPSKNTLKSVGTNNAFTSDPDNIYLYANNLIQVNGLSITGRVDDVYMEAVTINLNNVIFLKPLKSHFEAEMEQLVS